MSTQGAIRDYVHVMPAGAEVDIHARGDYVRLKDADGGKVRITTDNGDSIEAEAGEGITLAREYTTLRVRNESGVEIRAVLAAGKGRIDSVRTLGEVAPIPAGTIQAVGDIPGGDTIPANADRRELVVRASSANVGSLTIAGLPLEPGDVMTLEVTGAVAVGGDVGDVLHVAEVV